MPKDISAEEKEILKKINKRKADVKRWGIDPENSWKATYEISPGKEKVVKELRAAAKNVDHIYLATDLDREGEAIAWHLK
jgi:DNA topoisomerase-1